MRKVMVALALALCCGCQSRTIPNDGGARSETASAALSSPTSLLVNRVWARTDSTVLPGVMLIFLSDGTLVMDSCWETYRLEKWRWESDSSVVWQEDASEIRATIVELGANDLALRLDLADGSREEHFRVAQVPFLCPEMKR